MTTRDEFVAQMQTKLSEWNDQIREFEIKSRAAEIEARQRYHVQIAELRSKRDRAVRKLREIQNASDDAWEELRNGAQEIWNDVNETVRKTSQALSV